jgi:hypothetical protein
MADQKSPGDALQENGLVAKLLAQGAENAVAVRGFIGPSKREGYIRVYPRIVDLSESVEIARADVVHSMRATQSPEGPVVLWVKRGATISSNSPAEKLDQPARNMVEVRKGRLRMRMRTAQASDLCFSTCMDCLSWCSCSLCSSTCATKPA